MKLRHVLGAGIALSVAISVLGAIAGPAWRPRTLEDGLEVTGQDTAVATVPGAAEVGTYEYTEELRSVQLDGAEVTALVRTPVGAGSDLPAVVFLHGAGTATYEGFAQQAEDLASAGVVTVVPDKRMDTYTTLHRDYLAMAADYTESVDLALSLPEVGSVGLYSESEGCYVAPVMAAQDARIAFSIMVSPPVVMPYRQSAFATDAYLTNVGVPASLYRVIPRALGVTPPFGWLSYGLFDPEPYQQRQTQPTFVAYGTADASMPLVQGALQLTEDLAVAGNDQWTVRYYGGANHGIRVNGALAAGFTQDLADWIHGLPESATDSVRVAGDSPTQVHRADDVPTPRWYLNGVFLLITPAAIAAVTAGGAVAGGALWLRRRGGEHHLHRQVAGWLAAGTAATALTWAGYALYVKRVAYLAFNYLTDPPFTYGAYAVEQVAAVGAAVLVGGAALAAWQHKVKGADAVVVGLNVAGSVGALVLLAYFSGFPDITGGFGL